LVTLHSHKLFEKYANQERNQDFEGRGLKMEKFCGVILMKN